MRLALNSEHKFIIKNIGSGPALNLDYVLRLATEASLRDPHSHPRKLPYLAPLDTMPGPVPTPALGLNLYTFEATYRSLSGKLYRTEMKISSGILQEEWIFQQLAVPEKWWRFFF